MPKETSTAPKLQYNLYKMDPARILGEGDDTACIDKLCKETENKGYEKCPTRPVLGYKVALYHTCDTVIPKWHNFFNSILSEKAPAVEVKKNRRESFILYLSYGENIYAIAGGSGYFAFQNYIQDDFGLDILSRLIDKNDPVITENFSITPFGNVLGKAEHLRSNVSLDQGDEFGKIYKTLVSRLDQEKLKKFPSLAGVKEKASCIAKDSFLIKRALNFDELRQLIKDCEKLLEETDPVQINNIKKIEKKRNGDLVNALDAELYSALYKRYEDPAYEIDFDIFHEKIEEYFSANAYKALKGKTIKCEFEERFTADEFFKKIKDLKNSPENEPDFKKFFEGLRILSYDSDENFLTGDTFIRHVFGDVLYTGERYFFLNGIWWQILSDFLDDLNTKCSEFISGNFIESSLPFGLNSEWGRDIREGHYNAGYHKDENTIVLDQVIVGGIELCDVLKWDDDNLYLYHVKSGFNNRMRELCSQIFVSAGRVAVSKNSAENKEFMKKIWDAYAKKFPNGTKMEKEDFLNLFEKEIIYVAAIRDKQSRDIKNIKEFHSSIAKVSLQELARKFHNLDIKLKIMQIKSGQAEIKQADVLEETVDV